MTTLGHMPTHFAHDNVISLASARARRSGGTGSERTLLIQASNIQADREVHRQIGVDAALALTELHKVLGIAFGVEDDSPWFFANAGGRKLDSTTCVGRVLDAGGTIIYIWGLWQFELHCLETYPRDSGTPRALCIGGSGVFTYNSDLDFDLAVINAELTGTDTIRSVLTHVRPEIIDIVDRTGVFDFIPLLQALELHRPTPLDAPTVRLCRSLPRERGAEGSDAFWSCVLALSCLGDRELFDDVITSTMSALGWVADDGSPLPAADITAACTDSLAVLEKFGAYGRDLAAPVERLDIYRELLRA
ncbi:hypothetical protein HMPREF0290_2558 [Corynebacterium efficiens YS-314]|nr:hypothetical protein HMPREF0290_2558 [Corynebacterium efficiens YS-314]